MPSQRFLKWLGLSDRPKKLKWNILIYKSRKEIMFFCRFNGFLKLYWIIIKILWKLYEMYIQSREEIMFFVDLMGFWIIANLTEPISNNFKENSLSLLYLSHTQNLAWQTRENHQKINRSTEMTHIIRIRNQHDLDLRFCQITYWQKTYCPIDVCQITFCQKAVCQKTFCLLTDTP